MAIEQQANPEAEPVPDAARAGGLPVRAGMSAFARALAAAPVADGEDLFPAHAGGGDFPFGEFDP